MQQPSERSLRELQREMNRRAWAHQRWSSSKPAFLTPRVEIRQRVSPENIKAEVSGYVRSRGEKMLEDITSAARRNRMQAVAVGASLAYPLLRFARSIPMPVFMVGAGLFFAARRQVNRSLRRRLTWLRTCRTKSADAVRISRHKQVQRSPRRKRNRL